MKYIFHYHTRHFYQRPWCSCSFSYNVSYLVLRISPEPFVIWSASASIQKRSSPCLATIYAARLHFFGSWIALTDGIFVKSHRASAHKCPATWSYKIQSPHGLAKELFQGWHQNLLMAISIFRIVKNWVFQVSLGIHNVVLFYNFFSPVGFCQCFQIHTTKPSSSIYLRHQAWTTTSHESYRYPNDHYSPEYGNQV